LEGIRKIQPHVRIKELVIENSQSKLVTMLNKFYCATVEEALRTAKKRHGLRLFITAIAQNIKKIAKHLAKQSSFGKA